MLGSRCTARRWTCGDCRQAGFNPRAVQKDVWLMQTIVGLVASGIGVALPLSPVLMAELLSASTQLYAPRQDVVVTSKLNDLVRGPAPSRGEGLCGILDLNFPEFLTSYPQLGE
jgi:hypothetical protein